MSDREKPDPRDVKAVREVVRRFNEQIDAEPITHICEHGLEPSKAICDLCWDDIHEAELLALIARVRAETQREERARLVRIAEAHGPDVAMAAIGFKRVLARLAPQREEK